MTGRWRTHGGRSRTSCCRSWPHSGSATSGYSQRRRSTRRGAMLRELGLTADPGAVALLAKMPASQFVQLVEEQAARGNLSVVGAAPAGAGADDAGPVDRAPVSAAVESVDLPEQVEAESQLKAIRDAYRRLRRCIGRSPIQTPGPVRCCSSRTRRRHRSPRSEQARRSTDVGDVPSIAAGPAVSERQADDLVRDYPADWRRMSAEEIERGHVARCGRRSDGLPEWWACKGRGRPDGPSTSAVGGGHRSVRRTGRWPFSC